MPSIRVKQHGFTLVEVLVAATIIGLVAITQIPRLQGFLEERVREEAISDIRKLSNSLRQFRATQNADPTSVTQLINSDFYDGNPTLPWGAGFNGAPIRVQDPNAPTDPNRQVSAGWVFSFDAQSIEQAALLSEELGDLQAQVVGSTGRRVQWTVNASLLEVNQFQFIARTAEGQQLCPTCNEIEIDLDFRDSGSIDNVQDFDASQGQIRQASVGQVRLDASHAISVDNNNLTLDSSQTRFSGDVEVAQNLTATGQTRLQGGVTIQGGTFIDGDAQISGNATVNGSATLNGSTTIAGNAQVNQRLTVANNATISGNVTGGFFSTTGDFSTQLTSLSQNRRDINANTNAIAINASLIRENADAIRSNTAQITSNSSAIGTNSRLISTNNVLIGDNARGIGDNARGIGDNARDISTNAGDISTNAVGIGDNARGIGDNARDISTNSEGIGDNADGIRDNARDIIENGMGITKNGMGITKNEDDIRINRERIDDNTDKINDFQRMWNDCVENSGCRVTPRSDQ